MYDKARTAASELALSKLARNLTQYHEDIVIAGGWAPYYITQGRFHHCGSEDIDLVLKTKIPRQDESICDILRRIGYIRVGKFQFQKRERSPVDNWLYSVELDLLCEEEGAGVRSGLCEVQEGLKARPFRGLEIAFDFNYEPEIGTNFPLESHSNAKIKVIDLVGCFALKGQSLKDRDDEEKKLKDAYDIFALTYYGGGPSDAATHFNQTVSRTVLPLRNLRLLQDSYFYIRDSFSDKTQIGPVSVETFAPEHSSDRAVARMKGFLDNIKFD
jgi:hypothetical protein